MIKVTLKSEFRAESKGDGSKPTPEVKGHKDGEYAAVFNGVLTIYSKNSSSTTDYVNAVAGYEPGSWASWEKAPTEE